MYIYRMETISMLVNEWYYTRRLTCFLLVEIPLLFCITAVSLAHSLNTAIGLALTCRALDAGDGYADDER